MQKHDDSVPNQNQNPVQDQDQDRPNHPQNRNFNRPKQCSINGMIQTINHIVYLMACFLLQRRISWMLKLLRSLVTNLT